MLIAVFTQEIEENEIHQNPYDPLKCNRMSQQNIFLNQGVESIMFTKNEPKRIFIGESGEF